MAAILAFAEPRVLAVDGLRAGIEPSVGEANAVALLLLAGIAFLAYQLVSSLVALRSAIESADFLGRSNR